MTPMRDGVALATDLYFPTGAGPWPVILVRTPYSRREPYMFAPFYFYIRAGFVVAVQDCRGRFDSGGVYRPFVDDMEDGYDTVEWLASQSWSTGKVGMTGASAMGITSYMAAMAQAPHLAAGAVMMARNPCETLSRFPGGLFLENGAGGWSASVGVTNPDIKVPHVAEYRPDDQRVDLRRFYPKIKTPFIHYGGWFDIHQQPIIDNFVNFQAKADAPARGNQKLIMVPDGHMAPVKGVAFPDDTLRAIPEETALRWFNHWLKGEGNGAMDEPVVRYYLMGDTFDPKAPGNEWRAAPAWPPAAEATSLYLQPDGALAAHPPRSPAQRSYVYDPKAPVPTLGGNNLYLDSGPLDQRPVSARADVLRFIGEPLPSATEVVGQLTAKLWVSTDAEDTDFIVKLIDIHPDGFEALVRDQGLRLRHYKGDYSQTRTRPGEVYPIIIDLWSTALVFNKGHRIGVLVQSSNWPRFERHTNTWERLDSYDQAVKANNTVHMGSDHPSQIILPVTRIYS
jgi:predicted acyl esterase